MQQVKPHAGLRPAVRRAGAGFTLIEAMVALAILSTLLALGIPHMSEWVNANKAAAATEFYAEGFALARAHAVSHNSASRLVLTENPGNGQMDWQVDICFPTAAVPCNAESGAWSTTTAAAARPDDDSGQPTGSRSVLRRADSLPGTAVLAQSLSPSGATDVYFTSLGWVDTNFSPRLTRIGLAPAAGHAAAFPASALVLTLAGIVIKCVPDAAAGDARSCPP